MSYIIKKDGNQFYIGSEPLCADAVITYVFDSADTIMINHTYVSPKLRGKGIAKKLIDEVVIYARQNKLKIVPLCSYADQVMHGSDEYCDVLASHR
jgi:hypothetical protein